MLDLDVELLGAANYMYDPDGGDIVSYPEYTRYEFHMSGTKNGEDVIHRIELSRYEDRIVVAQGAGQGAHGNTYKMQYAEVTKVSMALLMMATYAYKASGENEKYLLNNVRKAVKEYILAHTHPLA